MRLRPHALLMVGLIVLTGGCTTAPPEIDVLTIEPGAYGAAFDAAVAAVTEKHLPPVLRDRRGGVIEAGPGTAASIVEPWFDDGATFDERIARTIGFYRRRARFEFAPPETPAAGTSDHTLRGADVLGLEPAGADRTTWSGPLELRVSVYLEQSHRPGLRPYTWSRGLTTYTEIITPATVAEDRVRRQNDLEWLVRDPDDVDELQRRRLVRPPTWTPVVRDTAFERLLLAEVERTMMNE